MLTGILPLVARMHPGRPAFIDGEHTLTYAQLFERASRLAAALAELGLRPGERVGLLGWPCPGLAEAEMAAVAVGAVPFSAFPQLATPEITQIIEDADPAILVYAPDAAPAAAAAGGRSLRQRICTEAGGLHANIDALLAERAPLRAWHEPTDDDVAILIYTGGTTGRAKGVMHTHRSIGKWFLMRPPAGAGSAADDERAVLQNLAHITGQHLLWTSILSGATLVFPPRGPLRADVLVDLVERHRVTSLSLQGGLLHDFTARVGRNERAVRSLRTVSHGAAPVAPATLRHAASVLAGAALGHGYGQTESGLLVSGFFVTAELIARHPERLASAGIPQAVAAFGQRPAEVRVVDTDGNEVPAGETGEVACRGEILMSGYWRDPEATAAVMRAGWLHTGDVGRFDADGWLHLVDRVKDMVIVGSSKVYCAEVERVLDSYPRVAESAVVGTPGRSGRGEEVTAVVVPQAGISLTLEGVRRFCRDKIAEFKIPTRLQVVSRLPRTPVDKIDKVKLREALAADHMRRLGT